MFDPVPHLIDCLASLHQRRGCAIEELAGCYGEDGTPTVDAVLADIDYFIAVYSRALRELRAR